MKIKHPSDIPQEPEWREENYKDVIRYKHFFKERLPLPIVKYPSTYGTWLAFLQDMDSPPYFCTCQKQAMINFIRINNTTHTYHLRPNSSLLELFIGELSIRHPHISTLDEFIRSDCFRDNLCHKCNLKTPSVRWSNSGEHSVFVQHFGWYWQQRLLEHGIDWYGTFLPEECPQEIKDQLIIDPWESRNWLRQFYDLHNINMYYFDTPLSPEENRIDFIDAYKIHKQLKVIQKNIENTIEADLREHFGFPKRGRTTNYETLLFLIVNSLFPNEQIVRHARPKWLKPLTLDIYFPDRNIALEYQGIQHYKPLKHLGGKKGLGATQKRDKRKADLCETNDCKLIYFDQSDKFTEEYVGNKLAKSQG